MAGDFHIGLIPTIGPFLLPMLMPVLSQEFPKAKLYLYELQTDVLLKKLSKGEIDAAILAKVDSNHSLQEVPLYKESMRLAVRQGDPISKLTGSVDLSVLNNESVLMLEDGHCLRDQALGVCFSAGAHEDVRFQATSMDTLLHMVATGTGMTLVPELASRKPVSGVSYISFNEPQPSREIVMLVRNNTARKKDLCTIADCIGNVVNG